MTLTRHLSPSERWALDGRQLPQGITLGSLLSLKRSDMMRLLDAKLTNDEPLGERVAPIEREQEVWASGVTYLRSRVERESESTAADVYSKVYVAERPEIFFKSIGWRVVGVGGDIRIRRDSTWNVPEPELTLVINRHGEVVGYTAGNDMSSRSIEGENPLYLPQAKTYDGSCALGPAIVLAPSSALTDVPIHLAIVRKDVVVFEGDASTSQMKRALDELAGFLTREVTFPSGAFLMTGTGIIPPPDFTLEIGDRVSIRVGELLLCNVVG